MCGQSIAYNIYATLGHTNPLFMGFLGYQNVNKEIIQPNIEKEQQTPKILYFRGFLYIRQRRRMQQLPGKKAESQRSREILRQMHFQPRHIRVCAMPTRIIIPAWRQRILPKVQRREQPARVPGSSMVESCGSTKSWSGWRKRQIKMP